jgi:phosphoglycerate-specific signal transduction histidine kinase
MVSSFQKWKINATYIKIAKNQIENGPKVKYLRSQEQELQNLYSMATNDCGFTEKDVFDVV